MDARCPECEKVAVLDDEITKVKCPHCNFEADLRKVFGDYEGKSTQYVSRLYSRQVWSVKQFFYELMKVKV